MKKVKCYVSQKGDCDHCSTQKIPKNKTNIVPSSHINHFIQHKTSIPSPPTCFFPFLLFSKTKRKSEGFKWWNLWSSASSFSLSSSFFYSFCYAKCKVNEISLSSFSSFFLFFFFFHIKDSIQFLFPNSN